MLVITLNIAYTVLTFYIDRKNQAILFKTVVLIVSALLIIFSPDILFRQFLLKGIRVTETCDTPYGNITRGEYHSEASTFYNQRLLIYSNDDVESEEDIHYGLLQSETPDNILLISGPLESRLKEINKYNARNVVYVERDPALFDTGKLKITNFSGDLQVTNDDAYSFVRKSSERFDAVIMLLPPPSSLLLNRFYTNEFFVAVKRIMKPDGVFSCSPGINPNYFSKESVRLYSSVFNSLKSTFENVIPVSGNKLYFIASDYDLSTSFCEMVSKKNLNNVYVGPDYLSDDLVKSKSDEIISLMDSSIKQNRSVFPIACFYYQSFNLSKSQNEKIPAIIILMLLLLLSLRYFRQKNAIMYFSAFTLAGYEIILLLTLQLTIGNMYQITGLIIAGLLAGLAVGSGIRIELFENKNFDIKVLLLILFYVIAGLSVETLMAISNHFVVTGLLVLSGFLPAVITGSFFRDLTSGEISNSDSSNVYSADLSGSALGFIIFSGFAVPFFGISTSLFILPFLVFTGFLFTSTSKKS